MVPQKWAFAYPLRLPAPSLRGRAGGEAAVRLLYNHRHSQLRDRGVVVIVLDEIGTVWVGKEDADVLGAYLREETKEVGYVG